MNLRARCALAAAATAALATLLVGTLGWYLAARADAGPPPPRTTTVIDQSGDRVSIVREIERSTDDGGSARAALVRWAALVALVAVPLAGVAGWYGGPRLLALRELERDDQHDAHDRRVDPDRLQEVVHELRTPLAVTATNLDLVDVDDEDDRRHLDAARRAVGRMARTVDDLEVHGGLAFAGSRPDGVECDLVDEVAEVAAEHEGPARVAGVRIVLHANASVVVPADRAAVRTVVANLLSNAVRHAPRHSTIALRAGVRGDWTFVSVTDTGPGIDPGDHPLVFRRHWRGRYETDRGDTATRGLGLTIARQMAEAQGGRITVSSEVGSGSTFSLWLPRVAGADASEVVAVDGIHPRTTIAATNGSRASAPSTAT